MIFLNKLKSFPIKASLPLLLVVSIALIVAVTNIEFGTYYSGWDNIHAEFNLGRYAHQVIFGSWLEHQAFGAPAAQAHLSEIFRLPFLLIFKLLLPDSLIRYAYIFLMYLVGGVGVYLYLSKFWLNSKTGHFKEWLASLGAVFYLLHLITLQQYYIAFEMFMTQFAFLPFLLMSIHLLKDSFSKKNLLLFVLVQLLIAPSAHTPTVFYLAVLFSLIYSFFLKIQHGFLKAVKFSFVIGLFTFLANIYWIVPNLYYSINNAHYVEQSRTNALFATESLWSVREAGTLKNFLAGTQYLFNWKDYSFADNRFVFIFDEWLPHLSNPVVMIAITFLGIAVLFGLLTTAVSKDKGYKRWAVIIFYLFSASLIWIDILPTKPIIDWLFQFGPFLEVFRNPFTKLSILYFFVLMIFFVTFSEYVVEGFVNLKKSSTFRRKLGGLFLAVGFVVILTIAAPTFQGNFISEKLRIRYPGQYWQFFDYMRTRDKHSRVLQLPQYSHAGWVYHDWGFIKPGNGYQGMDFTFFGLPQAMLNRDSDRWVETSDFFYHQLRHVLDKQDPEQLAELLDKYNIDLAFVDETKISSTGYSDYRRDHEILRMAGMELVWQLDFISVYERPLSHPHRPFIVPSQLSWINAVESGRIRQDYPYSDLGDYILTNSPNAEVFYPFSDLMTVKLDQITFENEKVIIEREIPQDSYKLSLPGWKQKYYQTPVLIEYADERVRALFPKNTLIANNQEVVMPRINDFSFRLEEEAIGQNLIIFFNDQGFVIEPGEIIHPLLTVEIDVPIEVAYSLKRDEIQFTKDGMLEPTQVQLIDTLTLEPDWSLFRRDIDVELTEVDKIVFESRFPIIEINLQQNPSENCERPSRGSVLTTLIDGEMFYQADGYGVNCNGYSFDFVSSSYPAILRVSGRGVQGRGTKFFVSYTAKGVLVEEYMMPQDSFDLFLSLHPVTNDPRSQFLLNWETRSFGRVSKNVLSKVELSSLPLNYLAQMKLEPIDLESKIEVNNLLDLELTRSPFDFLHFAKYRCNQDLCYLGLDQSYDDMWIGLSFEKKEVLPHLRLNNWANLWQLTGEGHFVAIYLPELISLGGMLLVVVFLTIIFIEYKKEQK